MEKTIDLGLKVKESLIKDLEDAYADMFGYTDKIVDKNPKWKPTKKQMKRPLVDNPESKRDFMLFQIRKSMRKVLMDYQIDKEIKATRQKQKQFGDLI